MRPSTMKSLVLGCLGVLALSACGGVPAAAPGAAPESSRPEDPATRDFDLSTHCGVEHALIDGRWWHVVDPMYGEGGPGTGPPDGWHDPFHPGRVTVVGSRAVFTGGGQRVVLTPAPTDEPVRVCR